MIRALRIAVLLVLPLTATAEGLDLTDAERRAFGEEVRATLLAHPEIVDNALNPPPPDVYGDAARADRDRLAADTSLFAPTARGIGADDPRVTVVFFEDYPCADCAAAWAEAKALVAAQPDIRVEPRFARESGVAQLLLSKLDREGPEAYHAARDLLLAAQDEAALQRVLDDNRWFQDRMLRPAPRAEAEAFERLELEMAPSFVLPDMMVQGAVPAIVLQKYVAE
ncbi:hypothetical protein [Pseudooceanicola sp. MF1-13]|uniref:hypothetical protein n=1 Tax=Pseudooceanicola sp. MF1-13 TaxID=3379095 RepID=UPI00389273AD